MPELHIYISDEVAVCLKRKAKARGMSLSKFLAEIVEHEPVVAHYLLLMAGPMTTGLALAGITACSHGARGRLFAVSQRLDP